MTLGESILLLKQYQGYEPMFSDGEKLKHSFDLTDETVDTLLAALRPVSREQVEMVWRGEWTVDEFGHKCSKCGEYLPDGEDVRKPQFCPECGRAMTDEAVEMVMEKINNMEEMTNEH